MASPADRSTPDPLVELPVSTSRFVAAPERTPVGNSIRTLLLVVALLGVGLGVWWWRRPEDVATRIGARTWAMIEADGQPVATPDGRVPTFVLDGTHEVRAAEPCAARLGTWTVERESRLVLAWSEPLGLTCATDPAGHVLPIEGSIELDGAEMTIEGDGGTRRAIALDELDPAGADDLAGIWTTGSSTVEFGVRGLLRIDDCTGSWTADVDHIVVDFDSATLGRDDCPLANAWVAAGSVIAGRHGESLFVRRDLPVFPVDREVHWLVSGPPPAAAPAAEVSL